MAGTDGSLIFDTSIDRKGFEKGLVELKNVGKTALKAVTTAIMGTVTAVGAMGGYALKASIDFESAFAGVRKTVDATEEELAMLEKGIRDMAKRLPQSASAIAEVGEAAGQLGIKTENILDFTETMVMLGDATNMSSEQAATSLARLANITGMSQIDFDRLGSSIVKLGNNLATTEGEIVEMSLRLAGTSSQVGLTEHEMLALAGAMSSVGINAEAGGSSMSRAMQKINTEVLSGGKNLSKFAEISNMSVDEFSKAWREKPTDAITAFIKGLDEVNASGGDVTTMLKDLGINSIQEVDTLLRLSGASDVLTNALDMSAEAWEENIALAEEAAQRYETTESMIEILKNNVNDLAISVGDGLKESFRGGIGAAIEMVQQLADAFEQGGFEGLVEEIGTVLADVVAKVAEYSPIFLELASNMIMSFIQGIRDNQEAIGLAAIDVMANFSNMLLELIPEVMVLGIELLATFIQGIAGKIPDLVVTAMEAISTIVDSIMDNLPLILQAGVDILLSIIEGIVEALPELMTQIIELAILIADTLIDNLPLLIDAGIQIIFAIVEGLIKNLPRLIEEVPRIINAFADAIIEQLPMILLMGMKLIWEIIKGLIQAIPTLIKNIPQIIMAIVNVFSLYNFAQIGKTAITKIGQGISSMIGNIGTTARNLGNNVIKAFKNILSGSSIAEIGKNLVKGIWNGISNVTSWILDKIKGFGSSILKGIKGIFGIKSPSKIMRDQIGKNLTLGIGVGLEDGMPKLEKDIEKEMTALTKKMKASVDIEANDIGQKVTASSTIIQKVIETSDGSNDSNDINEIVITGNTFVVREEADIKKIAIELDKLKQSKLRGKGKVVVA
jgi:TP901 family phage tail tape measure protein